MSERRPILTGMAVDWGSAPDWLTAVTTTGAFVAAGYAARATWTLTRTEVGRDADRRAADAQAFQADYIAAWMRWVDYAEPIEFAELTVSDAGPGFRVRNSSRLPVYDVALEAWDNEAET